MKTTTVEQSQRKVSFLRRLWTQTKIDPRLSPERRARQLAAIQRKGEWHNKRIATVQQGINVALDVVYGRTDAGAINL